MEGAPTTARYRADDITKEWLELKAHVGGKQPEVVRRDRPAEVIVSLAAATALLPEARPKWLSRALESVTAGQTRPSDLFDVFSHARFAAGVSPALAAQMLEDLRQQASCFPEKLRKVILDEELPLGEKKRRAAQHVQAPEKANPAADEMFSRCIDFVRKNESAIQAVHALESRTYQVDLSRASLQQVWGITWSRPAFEQQRRVVQSVVAGSPADTWNKEQGSSGRAMRAGDELVAVNGKKTWEEMATFKDLLEARLVFVREPAEAGPGEKDTPSRVHAADGLAPPHFASGDYILDSSGSGWWGHSSGDWLFNKSEGIYFHSASGKLFMEDPRAPGCFLPVGGDTAALGAPSRLRGRVRWFSRSKGFGFIAPWPRGPDAPPGVSEDVFLHRSELRRPHADGEGAALPLLPLLPGAPVEFDLGMEDGKPTAVSTQQLLDLHRLCRAGFSGMSCARPVESAPVSLKAESGHTLVGCFAGMVTGRHGMGGAEFVALNLAKDLATSFQGREQGGQRGAKAAMLAGFQRTQHGFLQYAQRLSDNSAKLWLSAETSACCVLVFGPDKDGRAVAMLGDTGSGGHGLVVARDGRITSRLGASAAVSDEKPAQDGLKVFEHGLKGPSINFPAMPGARGPAPKGFGAHAANSKGGSAGLAVVLDICQLDWANDALILLASESFWACLDEEKAASSALAAVAAQKSPEQVLMEEIHATRRGAKAEELAVTVLRFTWVDLMDRNEIAEKAISRPAKRRRKTPKVRLVQEVDDIFAQPVAGEGADASEDEEEEEEEEEGDSDEECASSAAAAQSSKRSEQEGPDDGKEASSPPAEEVSSPKPSMPAVGQAARAEGCRGPVHESFGA